jgi:hypothetical protein
VLAWTAAAGGAAALLAVLWVRGALRCEPFPGPCRWAGPAVWGRAALAASAGALAGRAFVPFVRGFVRYLGRAPGAAPRRLGLAVGLAPVVALAAAYARSRRAPAADSDGLVDFCPSKLVVRGRVTDARGRPVIAELVYVQANGARHYTANDGRYEAELAVFSSEPQHLWVDVRPLYPGFGDTATLPYPPSPARWRAWCRPGRPPALDTAVGDFRLPAPRVPAGSRGRALDDDTGPR